MRDIILTLFVFGSIPILLRRPDLAVLMFYWISFMNPHRLCWGFAINLNYAQVTAITLLLSLLIWKEKKIIKWLPVNIFLLLYVIWMTLTTYFAFEPELSWPLWSRMWRIQLITFITMMVMTTRERIHYLIWVIAVSLGFYGIKGGIFTILHAGSSRVWGPEGSFIGGNNEIGLALCMVVPLFRYLMLTESAKIISQAMMIAILLTLVTILGTHSRGALLGMLCMIFFLAAKSRNKLTIISIIIITIPAIFILMPESWHERISTIRHYKQDESAIGRINAWGAAYNVAKDNLTGVGFRGLPIPRVFEKYAENPLDIHDAHSIYFQVLAEHGFPGLFLFIMIGFFSWRLASSLMSDAKGNPDRQWIYDLASMIQVSMIGYWSAGAFLGLADFDLYYCIISILVCCKTYIMESGRNTADKSVDVEVMPAKQINFIRPVKRLEKS